MRPHRHRPEEWFDKAQILAGLGSELTGDAGSVRIELGDTSVHLQGDVAWVEGTLNSANLSSANLSHADLTGADLFAATVNAGTIFSNVTWVDTTCPDNTNSTLDGGTCIDDL